MSNCNFTQLSTYYDIQISLSNYFRNNPNLSAEELKPSVEGFLVGFLQHNLKEELTPDILNYMHGAVSTLLTSMNFAILHNRDHGYPISVQESGPFDESLHQELVYFFNPEYLKDIEKAYVNLKASITKNNVDKPDISNKTEITSGKEQSSPEVQNVMSENSGYVRRVDTSITIKKPGDIDKMFRGAINAQNKLDKILASNLINRYLIHADNRYNITNEEIDTSIKKYKEDIFRELTGYVNIQEGRKGKKKLKGDYYQTIGNRSFINGSIEDTLSQIKSYYNGLDLTAGTLEAWEVTNPVALKQYLNYIIISNFDSLLQISGKGVYHIASSTINNSLETKEDIKYSLKLSDTETGGFNAEELYPLLGEQSSIFKKFISSVPHIKRDGTATDLHKWDISTINANIARLFQDIRDKNRDHIVYDKSNALESMRKVFEFFLKNHFNSSISQFKGSQYSPGDQEIILSIYLTFFANKESDLNDILGKGLASKVKKYAETSLYTLDANTHNYTLNPSFSPINIIVSNFNKTYFNKYSQIVYNKDMRGIMFETLDAKVYESDVIFLKNTMNGFSNLPIKRDRFAGEVEVDANLGIATFNLGYNEVVTVNLSTGTISYAVNGAPKNIETLSSNERFLTLARRLLMIPVHKEDFLGLISLALDSGGWTNTITTISNLMGASAMVREIVKQPRDQRQNFISSHSFLSGKNSDLYNADLDSYLMQTMYNAANTDITNLASAFSVASGAMNKAVTKVASGRTMPLHTESRHLYLLHEMMDYLEEANEEDYGSFPIKGNLFFTNRDLLETPIIRTYIKKGEETKHSSELSPVEFMMTNIMYEYLGSLNTSTTALNPTVYIQPTVFTDKNMHYLLPIKMNSVVNIEGITKSLGSFDTNDFHHAMFITGGSYYKGLSTRILTAFIPVLKHMGVDTSAAEKEQDSLKALPLLELALSTVNMEAFKTAFFAVNKDSIPLMEEISFRSKPNFGLSETLLEYAKMYSDRNRFEKFIQRSKNYFARDLADMKFRMEYKGLDSAITPVFDGLFKAISNIITKEEFEKDWVSDSGYVINSKEGKLNPLLEHYFLMHALISDNYDQISMGTIHNHPSKGDKAIPSNATEEERMDHLISLKKKAKFKREIGGTPGKPLNQNVINGTPNELKVISLSDIEAPVNNIFGITGKMVTSDGAKITPMVQIILQNNSLQDNPAGLTQKTLSSTLDPYYLGLDQDKSAEHPITNESVRRSKGALYDLRIFNKKMLSIPFSSITPNGPINILRNYNGKVMSIKDVAPEGIFYAEWNSAEGKYDIIQLTSIETSLPGQGFYNTSGTYVFKYTNLNTKVETEIVEPINSLFALLERLGAENSVSINEDGDLSDGSVSYSFSDASNYTLVNFINSVGAWTSPAGRKVTKLPDSFFKKRKKDILKSNVTTNLVPTQKTVWQPLKEAFFNTVAFASGEKSGARSTQDVKQFFADDSVVPLAFPQHILSTFSLLNSEHESEDSELSEMSQIISALIFNSETLPEARRAYVAISKLIEVKLRKLVNGIAQFETSGNKDALYKYVVKMLVSSFTERDQKSIAGLLANIAANDSENDGDISGYMSAEIDNMPFSSYIYNQFNSMLASTISKDAIRRKFSGLAGPIKSSGGFINVFDIKDATGKIRTVSGDVFHTKYNGAVLEESISVDEVALYDWVKVNGEEIYLDSIGKLLTFRKNTSINVERVKSFSRASVNADSNRVYLFGDNTQDRTITLHQPSSTQAVIRGLSNAIGIDTKKTRGTKPEDFLSDADYEWFVNHVEEQIAKAQASGKVIVIPEDGIGTGKANLAVKAPRLAEYLNQRLEELATPATITKIYGKPRELKPYEITFSVESLEVPGEVLFSKYSIYNTLEFQTAYGLMDLVARKALSPEAQMCLTNPSIQQVLQTILGPHTPSVRFYKLHANKVQLIAKNLIQRTQRRLAVDKLITINGVDYKVANIVVTPGEAMGPNIHRTKFGLPEGISVDNVSVQTFVDILNKKSYPKTRGAQRYIVNADGNHLYFFNKEEYEASKDTRFRDASDKVVQLGDTRHVIDENRDNTYTLSEGTSYFKYVDASGTVVNALVYDSEINFEGFKTANKIDSDSVLLTSSHSLEKLEARHAALAQKMYASFQISLEYTSARIPGQGPQSFTPLRIIDFTHEENTILTNHFTTWLKGEDYDIDKGFWLGTQMGKNGIVPRWSKAFDYSSAAQLRLSMNLPVPTGELNYTPTGVQLTPQDIAILNEKGLTAEKVELLNIIAERGVQYPVAIDATEEEMTAVSEEEKRAYDFIDDYFMEALSDTQLEHGYKNVIARNMFNMIASPLNQIHAESPISFGEFETFKEQIVPKILSPLSPTTNAIIQDANMVGKDVIAIAATGLKVWSVLTYWANHKMLEGKVDDIVIGKKYMINDKEYTIATIANLNFNNGRTLTDVLPELEASLTAKLGTMGELMDLNTYITEFTQQAGLSEDESLIISSVLSAATDNAKELILQEVNGGQLTAGVYIYLAMMGIDLKDIIQFMNNKAVKKITELARKNIYDESTSYASMKTAIKYVMEGPTPYKEPRPVGVPQKILGAILWSSVKDIEWNSAQRTYLNGLDKKEAAKIVLSWKGLNELAKLEDGTVKDVLAKISTNADYTYVSGMYDRSYGDPLEQEMEAELYNTDFDEGGFTSATDMTITANRFIDRMVEYDEEISVLPKTEVLTFATIISDASEITTLGNILSSNRGVKSDAYSQYSFLLRYDAMMRDRIDGEEADPFDSESAAKNALAALKAEGLFDGDPTDLGQASLLMRRVENFVFEDYIKAINQDPNSDYVRSSKIIGKHFSRVVNILDIVDYVPHYKKMLHAVVTNENVKETLTIRDRSINELIKEIQAAGIFGTNKGRPVHLEEKNYLKLQTAFNDILAVKWLRSLKDGRKIMKVEVFEEAVYEGDELVTKEYPNGKIITIDLGKTEGRANFTKMFNNMILDLRDDPTYADNSFIQSLGIDTTDDPISGEPFKFFRLPMNLMNISEHNINEFAGYVTDFNKLNANKFGDNTIKDLFFIYTMLIHRDKANKSSFTKLFEKSTVASEDSLMKSYITTIAELDLGAETLKNEFSKIEGKGDYSIKDLLSRTISPSLDGKSITTNIGSYGHTIERTGKKKKIVFYKWVTTGVDVDGHDVGKYVKDEDYITQFSAIPLSIDAPATIELVNTAKLKRRNDIREAIRKANNNLTELTINCN